MKPAIRLLNSRAVALQHANGRGLRVISTVSVSRSVALVSITVFLICSHAFAANSDRWNGLRLKEATPQQVITALGEPKRDETAALEKLARNRVINGSPLLRARKNTVVRGLRYENLQDFKTVSFLFKDDTLVLIQLVPDKHNNIAARDMKGLYEDARFREVFKHDDLWKQAYGVDQATGSVRPRNYPVIYFLVGVPQQHRGLLVATIENQPGLSSILGGADATLPGRVMMLDLFGESLLPPKPTNTSLE